MDTYIDSDTSRLDSKIINRSVLRSATESGTANLCVDPIEPLSPDPDDILDEMMSTANFATPLSSVDPVDLIPPSIKSRTWQEMEQDEYVAHQEDLQQCHFHSEQPKSKTSRKYQYPTRSKTLANEATTAPEEKEFVFSQSQRGEDRTCI